MKKITFLLLIICLISTNIQPVFAIEQAALPIVRMGQLAASVTGGSSVSDDFQSHVHDGSKAYQQLEKVLHSIAMELNVKQGARRYNLAFDEFSGAADKYRLASTQLQSRTDLPRQQRQRVALEARTIVVEKFTTLKTIVEEVYIKTAQTILETLQDPQLTPLRTLYVDLIQEIGTRNLNDPKEIESIAWELRGLFNLTVEIANSDKRDAILEGIYSGNAMLEKVSSFSKIGLGNAVEISRHMIRVTDEKLSSASFLGVAYVLYRTFKFLATKKSDSLKLDTSFLEKQKNIPHAGNAEQVAREIYSTFTQIMLMGQKEIPLALVGEIEEEFDAESAFNYRMKTRDILNNYLARSDLISLRLLYQRVFRRTGESLQERNHENVIWELKALFKFTLVTFRSPKGSVVLEELDSLQEGLNDLRYSDKSEIPLKITALIDRMKEVTFEQPEIDYYIYYETLQVLREFLVTSKTDWVGKTKLALFLNRELAKFEVERGPYDNFNLGASAQDFRSLLNQIANDSFDVAGELLAMQAA